MPVKKAKSEVLRIKQGDTVKVDYEGKFDDGTVFDSSKHGDHSHPLEFEVGAGKIIKGFDSAVLGMAEGEDKAITLKPEDAYGYPNNDMVKQVPKKVLPQGQEPRVGMMLLLGTPDGHQFPARITEVSAETITIDLNHPLAGKTLHFSIKIAGISPR